MTQTIKNLRLSILFGLLGTCLFVISASAGVNLDFDKSKVRAGDIHVLKGESFDGDLIGTGHIVVEGTVDGDCVSLGGPMEISGSVQGDVVSLGAPATISGTINGDVAMMGGPLQISGTVNGAVESAGGSVNLSSGAKISGDLSLFGGTLTKAANVQIDGDIEQMNAKVGVELAKMADRLEGLGSSLSDEKNLLPNFRFFGFLGFLVFLAGIGFLALLGAVFFPKPIDRMANAIETDFWKSAGIGALIIMVLPLSLLLMAVSILGLPIIPLAILLVCAAGILSFASFSKIIASRALAAANRPAFGPVAMVGLGYLLLMSLMVIGKVLKFGGFPLSMLGGILAFANLMIVSCAILVGLGAAWITRMGSRSPGHIDAA